MGHKSDAESMQELTSLMWNRYLKERVKEEQNHEMNAYKAEVVTNNGDGTLTVKRPFESVNLTLKAASSLQFAQPGDMVLVVGIGDKSKALSNAFILCKTDLSDDTSVPVYGLGDNMLHNWYFAGTGGGPGELPVNLRGQSSYTGSGYTIDGWYARNSVTVGVQSDGIHLSFPSGVTTLKGLNQTFTAFRNYLVGKTVTVSVLVKDFVSFGSTSYPKFGLYSGDSVGVHSSGKLTGIISGNGLFTATGTLGSDILDYSNLNFTACYANSYSGSLTVVAAKMELGSKSTLAHQENGVWVLNSCPSYNEELLKCITNTVDSADTYANKNLSTEQQIAAVQIGPNANRAYAVNSYFCWNGFLYRATTAISSGALLTINTNCVATTVMDEIVRLTS